jgi:NAD(P)H-hydrate epimerase
MKPISCREMKEIDSHAIEKIGIPGIVLMENAALKVIKNIDLNLSHYTVVCGKGKKKVYTNYRVKNLKDF